MKRYCYPIVVYEERAAEGPLWIGNFPGLNGCWVEGSSKEDVLARAPSVIHEFASACRELGWPLPDPPAMSALEETCLGEVFFIEEYLPEHGEL
ncbi:MAG: hypothetical protein LUG14_01335 [Synergistaceae bacterium]|nr:hypothetical protein [Synergistaceae bacterium]MCD8163001.1 hypothetical protein [Synergistaceae bacterium]